MTARGRTIKGIGPARAALAFEIMAAMVRSLSSFILLCFKLGYYSPHGHDLISTCVQVDPDLDWGKRADGIQCQGPDGSS